MKVLGPLMSVEATGRIGGIVFARHRSGTVAGSSWTRNRLRVNPGVNPRATLHLASQSWSNTAQATRDSWTAHFGTPAKARQEYIARFCSRLTRGLTSAPVLPVYTTYPYLTRAKIVWTEAASMTAAITWLYSGAPICVVTVSAFPSYRQSTYVSPRAYKYNTNYFISGGGVTATFHTGYNTIALRLDVIHNPSATIAATHYALWRRNNVGDPSNGQIPGIQLL